MTQVCGHIVRTSSRAAVIILNPLTGERVEISAPKPRVKTS